MYGSLPSRLLTELLPPDLAESVRQHLLNPRAPLQIYKQRAAQYARDLLALAEPYIDRTLGAFASPENHGVVGGAMVLLTAVLALIIMNWVRRLVMWWTRLVFRMTLWAVVIALLAFIWNRGLMVSARDAVVIGGKIAGYGAALKDVWLAEYDRYEERQRSSTAAAGRSTYTGKRRGGR